MTANQVLDNLQKLRVEIVADALVHAYDTRDNGVVMVTQAERLAMCDRVIKAVSNELAELELSAA